MNQTKLSLADVLTLLAAFAFGFACFLGANFINVGQDTVWGMSHTAGCVLIAVVIALLLGGTAFGAKLLKRTSCNFKPRFIGEMVLLFLLVVFAIFFITPKTPFPHYFAVTAQKEQIQQQLSAQVEQVERMFAEYEEYADERENWYEIELTAAIAQYNGTIISPEQFTKYEFKKVNEVHIPYEEQKKDKVKTLHKMLRWLKEDGTDFEKMKTSAELWLSNVRKSETDWRPISVVDIVNVINTQPQEWKEKLVKLSEYRATGEDAKNFEYNLSTAEVTNYFTKFGSLTPLAAGLAALAYLLMLLSWVVTKRHPRFPGFKTLFGTGTTTNKEL